MPWEIAPLIHRDIVKAEVEITKGTEFLAILILVHLQLKQEHVVMIWGVARLPLKPVAPELIKAMERHAIQIHVYYLARVQDSQIRIYRDECLWDWKHMVLS